MTICERCGGIGGAHRSRCPWHLERVQAQRLTGVPVQGAGTDDELRTVIGAALPEHQSWCQAIAHVDCCGHNDCDCGVGEALDRLMPVVLAAMQRREQQAAAKAWDEGYAAAEHDAMYRPYSDTPGAATWKPIPSPYRPAALDPNGGPDQ